MTFTRTKKVEKSSFHDRDFPLIVRNELQEGFWLDQPFALSPIYYYVTASATVLNERCVIIRNCGGDSGTNGADGEDGGNGGRCMHCTHSYTLNCLNTHTHRHMPTTLTHTLVRAPMHTFFCRVYF